MEVKPLSELQGQERKEFERLKKEKCDRLLTQIQIEDQLQELDRKRIVVLGQEITEETVELNKRIKLEERSIFVDILEGVLSLLPIGRAKKAINRMLDVTGAFVKALSDLAAVNDEFSAVSQIVQGKFTLMKQLDEKIQKSKEEQIKLVEQRRGLGCPLHFPRFLKFS